MDRGAVVREINRRLVDRSRPANPEMLARRDAVEIISDLLLIMRLANTRMGDAVRCGPHANEAIAASKAEMERLTSFLTGVSL